MRRRHWRSEAEKYDRHSCLSILGPQRTERDQSAQTRQTRTVRRVGVGRVRLAGMSA
jgi:hypothetical protein